MRYLLIIAGLAILLSSCKKIKEPVFKGIQNLGVSKLAKGKSMLTLDMSYFNPNNINAQLKEAEGEAWMDSTFLGHFRVDSAVSIPANADFLVPVKLDVEMKNLFKHSLTAFLNEQVLITINGKAKVGKNGFYRKIPLRYEGKQNLAELFK